MLMASVFVSVGAIILLPYVDPNSRTIQILAKRGNNALRFVIIVLAFYPVWAAIGALTGLLFQLLEHSAPTEGLGSPNLIFTAVLLSFTLLAALPTAFFLRRSLPAVTVMAVAFAGLFGWALPYFAS